MIIESANKLHEYLDLERVIAWALGGFAAEAPARRVRDVGRWVTARNSASESSPIRPATLLRAHRREDVGADLWTTFNRLQEGLVRGGQRGFVRNAETGIMRRASVRAINGIDGSVRLNQALWAMAEEMARLKQQQAA
jgi:hypothetical protein